MKRILVPLDGSSLAEQVLSHVRMMAHGSQASIHLVRVVAHAEQPTITTLESAVAAGVYSPFHQETTTTYDDVLQQQAERYLHGKAAYFHDLGVEVSYEVCTGRPADAIAFAALKANATMIAMTTHGYGGLRRWALGSVADQVVHLTGLPVLLVRGAATGEAANRYRRILVPLDGSPLGRQALPHALELARQHHAEVTLLHVIAPLVGMYPGPYTVPIELERAERKQAQMYLNEVSHSASMSDLTVTPLVLVGYPADLIVDVAERRDIDLIVMGTHGYGGVRRWMLGSVADKVLHATKSGLLLIRTG